MKKDLKLRDYQVPIVNEAVKFSEGILFMSTGSGKTVVSLAIAQKIGLKTTIVVPNNVLLYQFVTAARDFFGWEIGIVNGDIKQIKDITVATYQSLLCNETILQTLVSQTGTLIVDECQIAVSDKRIKIIESFRPKHLYGLSATPSRSKDDGRTAAIKFYFGNICATHEMTQLTPRVVAIPTGVEIVEKEYMRMVEDMVRHAGRNKLIAGLVVGEALEGRKILVLTKRIEHYKALEQILGERDLFHYIDSEDKERNDKLAAFKNGDMDYTAIFGTTSLLAVGLDIPSFDTLILACDMKSEVLTVQAVGRILRLFEGKPEPKIIDLWDNKTATFSRQFRVRSGIYKQKGWEIDCKFNLS